MEYTLYEQLIEEWESSGYRKILSKIDENDVEISDNDEAIWITPQNCNMISIKGIRESKKGGKLSTEPHHIFMKVWDYNGEELRENDAIQFSLVELRRSPSSFPTDTPKQSNTVYYHYPYWLASSGIRLKKGIIITKDKKLELKVIRDGKLIKFWKLELCIQCHKWYKKEGD